MAAGGGLARKLLAGDGENGDCNAGAGVDGDACVAGAADGCGSAASALGLASLGMGQPSDGGDLSGWATKWVDFHSLASPDGAVLSLGLAGAPAAAASPTLLQPPALAERGSARSLSH